MSTDVTSERRVRDLVDAVMHTPVITLSENASLRDASIALRDNAIGTLVVMHGSEIAGILSERDVVRAIAGGADPDRAPAETAMSKEPRYLTTGEDAAVAVEVMVAAGIRHLPVLEGGELIGIVSIRDLVRPLRS